MWQTLSRIFSRAGDSQDPDEERILHSAVEAIVTVIDGRLRLLPNYQPRLLGATKIAVAHVRGLAQLLPPATSLGADSYRADPRLRLLFGSVDEMLRLFNQDATLRTFRAGQSIGSTSEIYSLLVAERQIKHVLGMELHGELIQREVPKRVLIFSDRRLRALATSEQETLRLVKIGAFKQLLQFALARINQAKSGLPIGPAAHDRAGQFQSRSEIDASEDFPLFDFDSDHIATRDSDSARLNDIDRRVDCLGPMALRLDDYIDIINDVLSHSQQYLRYRPFNADVDHMGMLVDHGGDHSTQDAEHITLPEFVRPDRSSPVVALVLRLQNDALRTSGKLSGFM